jgi:hypothetical protein
LRRDSAFSNVGRARLKDETGRADTFREVRLRRYELQLWEPDKGGWRTVLTAAGAESLKRSARTLGWQTQKPVRVVGPDGVLSHDTEGGG